MARFDVFRVARFDGLLLDVQATVLSDIKSRAVVPLHRFGPSWRPLGRLNPIFSISDAPYIMITQEITSVPLKALGLPVGSLRDHHDDIMAALDMLLTGF